MTDREHADAMKAHPRLSRRWVRARDALVVSALSVAESVARHYAARGKLDFDDLHGAACEGVLVAAERYDPDRGPFSSAARVYAAKYARLAIRAASAVRASDRAITERARVDKADAAWRADVGDCPPDDAWVAQRARVSVSRLRDLRAIAPVVSLDVELHDGGATLGDMMPATPEACPVTVAARVEAVERLLDALPGFMAHAVRVVQCIGVAQAMTPGEYAQWGERSTGRARRTVRAAVGHLRDVVGAMPADERARMMEACGL